jgi:mannan endo-1,4-beta-mannosidase
MTVDDPAGSPGPPDAQFVTVRRRWPYLAAAVVILVAVAFGVRAFASSGTADDFVTRSGSSFELGGKPFRFVGFNLYDAASSDLYSCSPSTHMSDATLLSTMKYLHDELGTSVIRFWAYQTYTQGGTDFSGMDRVVHDARSAGLRVIPVLEDGPGNCSTGTNNVSKAASQDDHWYTQGYKQPYGSATLSYRDYVKVVARHYRDNPTIMAWMMMNEAETQTYNSGGVTALADFALDIGTLIRSVDPHHLITLGTQGNGAPGGSGPDFTAIYRQPILDFVEVHDWARYGSDTEAMPGSVNGALPAVTSGECQSRTAPIACSFAIAKQLGKPLVVGEAGIAATDAAGRQRRATLFQAKISAAFADGASGYLVWQLNTQNTDGYAVIRSQSDPLVGVLSATAKKLGD